MKREPVPLHPRKGFTPKQRADVFLRADGRCVVCAEKITPGRPWDVEHRVSLGLGGTNDPDNLGPVHAHPATCHKRKSANDARALAKARRLAGETCTGPRKAIPSRGFPQGPARKIPSRPFPQRKKDT